MVEKKTKFFLVGYFLLRGLKCVTSSVKLVGSFGRRPYGNISVVFYTYKKSFIFSQFWHWIHHFVVEGNRL